MANVQDNESNVISQIIVKNPSLDLEAYAQSCTGLARVYRLIYVADVCPSLRLEALKLALSCIMETYNIPMYQLLHKKLSAVAKESNENSNNTENPAISSSSSNNNNANVVSGSDSNIGGENIDNPIAPSTSSACLSSIADQPMSETGTCNPNNSFPVFDSNWVDVTSKKSAQIQEKLCSDLKIFKINSIKESIRRGHDDLGDHYVLCGDLANALKYYSRARDYCTSGMHVIDMCWNVIRVSVYLKNWSHVFSYVSKAEAIPELSSANKGAMLVKIANIKFSSNCIPHIYLCLFLFCRI